jgi:hypothetical protein
MTRNILLAFLVPVWIVFAVIIGWFVAVFLFERLLGWPVEPTQTMGFVIAVATLFAPPLAWVYSKESK